MGSVKFVDRPARILIKETCGHGFRYKTHTRTTRNTGKEEKKTATAMHQSHFSSQNDLLWAGSLFCNRGIWNSDHVRTRRAEGERRSLSGSENAKIHSSLWREKKAAQTPALGAVSPPTLPDLLAKEGSSALGQVPPPARWPWPGAPHGAGEPRSRRGERKPSGAEPAAAPLPGSGERSEGGALGTPQLGRRPPALRRAAEGEQGKNKIITIIIKKSRDLRIQLKSQEKK